MGLHYTVHPVDVFGEEQFKPEFQKPNPNAKVPVITDHDGPAVTRALATVNEVRAKTTAFDKAEEGAKDRLFGRGRYAA
jgi:glutathione S-transferase